MTTIPSTLVTPDSAGASKSTPTPSSPHAVSADGQEASFSHQLKKQLPEKSSETEAGPQAAESEVASGEGIQPVKSESGNALPLPGVKLPVSEEMILALDELDVSKRGLNLDMKPSQKPFLQETELTDTSLNEVIALPLNGEQASDTNSPITANMPSGLLPGLVAAAKVEADTLTGSNSSPQILLSTVLNNGKNQKLATETPLVEKTALGKVETTAAVTSFDLGKIAESQRVARQVLANMTSGLPAQAQTGTDAPEQSFLSALKTVSTVAGLAGATAVQGSHAPVRADAPPIVPLASGAAFGTQAWSEGVANRVMWLTDNRMMTAELRLDPPDLGPLRVKISISDGQAQVSFVSQNGDVRSAIDQSVARLRELFEARDVELVNVDVSDQSEADKGAKEESVAADKNDHSGASKFETEIEQNAGLSLAQNDSFTPTGLVDRYI